MAIVLSFFDKNVLFSHSHLRYLICPIQRYFSAIECHYDREQWGVWFIWGFFRCKTYKKGTIHFEFLDEDV